MFACRAQLVLSGQFDVDEVTKRIGFKPTGARRRGDFIKGSFEQYHHDEWIISTSARRVGACEDSLFDLFSLVSPHAQALHGAAQMLECRIIMRLFVTLEEGDHATLLELSPEVLRRIEALGATLAIIVQPQS